MSTHVRTRFIVAALLAIMVACCIALPVSGVQAVTGKSVAQTGVLVQPAKLYASASTSSRILLSLKKGARVTILAHTGTWYRATSARSTGYLLSKSVKIASVAKPVITKPVTKPVTPLAKVSLTISAAASMTDAMNKIQKLYQAAHPNVTLTMNYGSSGTLEQQIEQGAPVDFFISAANKQMDQLEQKNMLLAGTRKTLLQNHLVLIVPLGSTAVAGFDDLTKPAVKFVAIGEPSSVPAGQYAQESLTKLGLWDKLQSKLVRGKDVRAVLTYVESKNADAGLVYSTDAKTSHSVRVVCFAPEDSHSPIVYPMAVLNSSKNQQAARDFETYLSSALATAVFRGYGFVVNGK